MKNLLKVFIQTEAGSRTKHKYNEKTLEYLGSGEMDEPYPSTYGFVLETTTDDGDGVDCFLLTQKKLSTSDIVECQAIGLLELFENGEIDHKVMAVFPEEQFKPIDEAVDAIRSFYEDASELLSKRYPGFEFKVGTFLPVEAAMAFIESSRDT